MAVALSHDWHCLQCQYQFYDPTDRKPCPQCGNGAGELLEAVQSHAVAQARAVMAPAAKPAPAKASIPSGGTSLLGIGALAIGIPLWLEGARTTRDGWVLFLNWVLARLGAPYVIPSSTLWPWWLAIGALALLGVAYSHIEVRQTPLSIFPWRASRTWQVWVVWVVFILSDVGTMYLGARAPRASDPAILHQIATTALTAGAYAFIITFVPERLVIFGWRKLRG